MHIKITPIKLFNYVTSHLMIPLTKPHRIPINKNLPLTPLYPPPTQTIRLIPSPIQKRRHSIVNISVIFAFFEASDDYFGGLWVLDGGDFYLDVFEDAGVVEVAVWYVGELH